MKIAAASVKACVIEIVLRGGSKVTVNDRTFRAFYSRDAQEIAEIWELFSPYVKRNNTKLKHLFWTLMYLKLYLPIDVMTILCQTSAHTFNDWVWAWLHVIAKRKPDFIILEHRNRYVPPDVWCRVSIDGTDFQIGEPTPFDRRWKSPKAKGAAVKYEVAVSIFGGDIVEIFGPHVGSKNDVTIFREKLKTMLDKNEMAEVDAGYKGEIEYLRSRDAYETEIEKKEKSEARARHETINRRIKQWGILKQMYRNSKESLQTVFYDIAVLTQLDIDNGNVPFIINPVTKKKEHYCLTNASQK